jgi:hypothetical protein
MVHPSQQSRTFRRPKSQACITLTLNGRIRIFPIRPWVAASGLGTFVLFLSAYVGATGYLIYRDDLLGATLARQVKMQYAYEDRIAALRSEIDRVTTRNLVQAHGVDEQLALLLNRQAQLQQRHASLAELLGEARSAGVALPEQAMHSPEPKQTGSAEGNPKRSGVALGYSPARENDNIITGALIRQPERQEPPRPGKNIEPVVSSIGRSLDSMQDAQSSVLDALESASDAKLGKISAALAPLGAEPKSRVRRSPAAARSSLQLPSTSWSERPC